MALEHAFSSASGRTLNDCHFLTRRWDPKADPEEGRIESSIFMRDGDASVGLQVLHGRYSDLFRLPSGRVYVASVTGEVESNDNPVRGTPWTRHDGINATRVWGLSDDLVFAWSVLRKEVQVFDGSSWTTHPLPDRIYDIHGVSPDLIVCAGYFVGRWDGTTFAPIAVDTQKIFTQVHVVDEDEMYANCDQRAIWEGSVYGWAERTPPTGPQNIKYVAKWKDRLWVGHETQGLCVLEDDNRLTVVKDNFPQISRIDVRGDLLVTTKELIASSPDGLGFKGVFMKRLKDTLASRPPIWER